MSVLRGSLLVLMTGLVFSFGGLAFRFTDDIGAWLYVVFRGLGALIVALLVLVGRHRNRSRELISEVRPRHLAIGGLIGSMSILFIVLLEHVTVAFILFIQTLAPLAAAWFSWLLLKERVSNAVLAATAVSMVGVAVMVSGALTNDIPVIGLLALGIPAIFGLYATLLRSTPTIDPQVPIFVAGLTMMIGGTIGAATTRGLGASLGDIAIALAAGAFLLGLPGIVLNRAATVVPAPETALLLMSEIIAAPIWVWIFVDETPGATTLIGGAIMFVAVMGLLAWRRNQAVLAGAARLPRRPL